MSSRKTEDIIRESDFLIEAFKQSRMRETEIIITKHKCPKNNKGICEIGMAHICKFNGNLCMVDDLVYSLFLRVERELNELS